MLKAALRGVALSVLLSGIANAGVFPPPLNLEPGTPDITTFQTTVTYDSDFRNNFGRLTATGRPTSLDLDGIAPPDFTITDINGNRPAEWRVRANVNQTTGELRWADIRVRGKVLDLSDPNNPVEIARGTLLKGKVDPNADPFGVTKSGDNAIFEFVFGDLSGKLDGLFDGGAVGVILNSRTDLGSNPFVDFESDFDNILSFGFGIGTADTFNIPEPSTLGVFTFALVGFGAVAAIRRRRR